MKPEHRITENAKVAADWLRQGGVLAYPTETLWGIGCDATHTEAVRRVFAIKERSSHSPVSVLVPDVIRALEYVEVDDSLRPFLYLVWPSALTFVLPVKIELPPGVGDGQFLGVRQSPDPFVKEIFNGFDRPVVTTSANPSGEEPGIEAHSLDWLPEDVLIYAPVKKLRASHGSTIVKIADQKVQVLRQGDFDLNEWQEDLARYQLQMQI